MSALCVSSRRSIVTDPGCWVAAVERLSKDFGTWRMRWGDVNRLQRASDFSDAAPSIAVPFTASMWGSLAAFGARTAAPEKKLYGVKGNSFVAIVEFGPRVRARAIMAGGASADPTSTHFADQAMRYTRGELRDVYFYPDQRAGKIERRYQISSWSARRARASTGTSASTICGTPSPACSSRPARKPD